MSKPNDSAFPCLPPPMRIGVGGQPEILPGHSGLTKREYFAALAMQGLSALQPSKGDSIAAQQTINRNRASLAVMAADALIAELSKSTEGGK